MPELRRVFLVATLEKLCALLDRQGDEALRHSDVDFPARATSTLVAIAKAGPVTAADIARDSNEPHQLVTQRIDLLLELKLISRDPDPADARRKLLSITPKGKQQLHLLKARLQDVEAFYADLFDEIGGDLEALATRAINALHQTPIFERRRTSIRRRTQKDRT